jgi:hypothetical protein
MRLRSFCPDPKDSHGPITRRLERDYADPIGPDDPAACLLHAGNSQAVRRGHESH